MNEIKVGDWTLTEAGIERIEQVSAYSQIANLMRELQCRECCEILGVDPAIDSVAKDICEEIVLHGTPVDEVVAKLQRHLESR